MLYVEPQEKPREVVYFATHNNGKMKEISRLDMLHHPAWDRTLKLPDHVSTDVEETGDTYLENALLKAQEIRYRLGDEHAMILADDSGLEIDACPDILRVHTARFMEGYTQEEKNLAILDIMKDIPLGERTARYKSVMVLQISETHYIYGTGVMEGIISMEPSTASNPGWGEYPIFTVAGLNLPFSELCHLRIVSNHRAKAYLEVANNYQMYKIWKMEHTEK